jgi:hypothetical protein
MFEFKVAGFAGDLCGRFITAGKPKSFLLELDHNDNVTSLSFWDGSREWYERAQAITRSEIPHLFYDPLDDGMEYIWLSWKGIERSVMERLIGQSFEDADFLPLPQFARRAGRLDPEKQFPQSWGVMF